MLMRCNGIVIALLLVLPVVARGAPTSFDMEGVVTGTTTIGASFGVAVGDPVTGSITYDPTKLFPGGFFDEGLPGGTGYSHGGLPSPSFSFLIDNVPLPRDTSPSLFEVIVANDLPDPGSPQVPAYDGVADICLFVGTVVDPVDANALTAFALYLIDYSATAFSDESPPVVSALSLFDYSLLYIDRTGVAAFPPDVTASIAVPEASSILLAASAALIIAWTICHERRRLWMRSTLQH